MNPLPVRSPLDVLQLEFPQYRISMQTSLRDLRHLFPFWLITYSPQLGAWVAKSQFGTICENSATLVRIALTRIEQRRRGNGTQIFE